MSELIIIRTLIKYHIEMTRRVWEALDSLAEDQFLAEAAYSRGSIRNLMVHLASTDRRWLAGLKNLPDAGHLNFEDYPTRAAAREVFENTQKDLADYAAVLTEDELDQNADGFTDPRWQILLHMVNHGTDHRSTVLQRLHEFGAPTFNQDLVFWLWGK